MAYAQNNSANDRALEIVKAALASHSIPLIGTNGDMNGAEAAAERDAEYLTTLIKKLRDGLASLP